jgi:hypothetical protein
MRHRTQTDASNARELKELVVQRRLRNLPEIDADAPSKMTLGFGRHARVLIKDLPIDYLRWVVNDFEPYSRQRKAYAAAVLELKRRESQPGEKA